MRQKRPDFFVPAAAPRLTAHSGLRMCRGASARLGGGTRLAPREPVGAGGGGDEAGRPPRAGETGVTGPPGWTTSPNDGADWTALAGGITSLSSAPFRRRSSQSLPPFSPTLVASRTLTLPPSSCFFWPSTALLIGGGGETSGWKRDARLLPSLPHPHSLTVPLQRQLGGGGNKRSPAHSRTPCPQFTPSPRPHPSLQLPLTRLPSSVLL